MAVVSLVAAAGVLFPWKIASSRAQDKQVLVDAAELVEHRAAMARVQIDELNYRLAIPLGITDAFELDGIATNRAEVVGRELAAIDELAEGSGVLAEEANELSQSFRQRGQIGPNATSFDLFEGSLSAQYDGFGAVTDDRISWLNELVWFDEVLTLTLNEALVATLELEQPPMSNDVASFVEEQSPAVFSFGGGFIVSAEHPLDSSMFFSGDADPERVAIIDELDTILAGTDLPAIDTWLRNLSEDPNREAPVSLDQFFQQSDAISTEIRAIVDTAVRDEADSLNESTNWMGFSAASWLGFACLLLAVAIALTIRIVLVLWRRSKLLRELVNRDPLTGVGNRNMLTERTASLLYSDELHYHVIITIDLDRFKVINDSFGHAAGDRILIHLATAFQRLANDANVGAHSVIRLGGDEFLISLHANGPISTASIRSGLDALRASTFDVGEGSVVQLDFSYGLAVAEGSPPLSPLMDASDLAAYEEKASRRPHQSEINIVDTVDAR